MEPFYEYLPEYRIQLENRAIKKAYKGLMEYIMELRNHFDNNFPDYFVSGSIYHGYMDMTYFSIFPNSLKQRRLKIPIVFLHDAFRFEVWLAGYNKKVQLNYWKLFRDSAWKKYQIVSTIKGTDSIVEHILVDNPDFKDLDSLTNQIESATLEFIEDVEIFLSQHES